MVRNLGTQHAHPQNQVSTVKGSGTCSQLASQGANSLQIPPHKPQGATPYKALKTRILKHFGPKDKEILATAESPTSANAPEDPAMLPRQT